MSVISFLCICALIFIGRFLWRIVQDHKRISSHVNKFPGPPALPFPVGNYFMLSKDHSDYFKQVLQIYEEYGQSSPSGIFRLWLGPKPMVVICKGVSAEPILSSYQYIEKSTDYEFLHPWLGTGLLTSTGAKWRSRRKFLTPAFHFQVLTDFMEVFYEQSQVMVRQLAPKARADEIFDICPFITRCTLDIISETAMGKKINAQTNPNSTYVKAVYRASDMIFERMINPFWALDFLYYTIGGGREFRRTIKVLHDFTDSVIAERRGAITSSSLQKPKRMGFLDALLHARTEDDQPLDDASIREEVDTFMFEGHDTTAAAGFFAVYFLGLNSQVQKRAHEEIDAVFGGSDRAPTVDDLKKLTYLCKIIKETLRLYPSVPFIGRNVNEDIRYVNDVIPKGSVMCIFMHAMHRDPEIFPNPEIFDPDRFNENTKFKTAFDYVPFSAGPRNCIGQKFALMEEKTILSTILRHYTIQTTDDPDSFAVKGELITRPTNGIHVRLSSRLSSSSVI